MGWDDNRALLHLNEWKLQCLTDLKYEIKCFKFLIFQTRMNKLSKWALVRRLVCYLPVMPFLNTMNVLLGDAASSTIGNPIIFRVVGCRTDGDSGQHGELPLLWTSRKSNQTFRLHQCKLKTLQMAFLLFPPTCLFVSMHTLKSLKTHRAMTVCLDVPQIIFTRQRPHWKHFQPQSEGYSASSSLSTVFCPKYCSYCIRLPMWGTLTSVCGRFLCEAAGGNQQTFLPIAPCRWINGNLARVKGEAAVRVLETCTRFFRSFVCNNTCRPKKSWIPDGELWAPCLFFTSSVVEEQVFLQQRSVISAKVQQISIEMTLTGGISVESCLDKLFCFHIYIQVLRLCVAVVACSCTKDKNNLVSQKQAILFPTPELLSAAWCPPDTLLDPQVLKVQSRTKGSRLSGQIRD